jgi:hypothetical protein
MADRLSQVHAELDAIRSAIAALERRLAALEHPGGAHTGDPKRDRDSRSTVPYPETAAETESRPRFEGIGTAFALAGRAFLAFGGAFVLRALTESQTVEPATGVWLGIAYALAWVAAAAWTTGASRLENGWLTLAIGLPLVLEAAGRMTLLSSAGGQAALTLVAGVPLLFAWRWRLPSLAVGSAIGGALVGVGLGLSAGRLLPFAVLTVGLGVGALWASWHREWRSLAWLSAGATNLTVLIVAARACVRPPSESPLGAEALLAGFGVVYIGSVVLRTLLHERSVRAFEVAQTVAVLLIGFGGAIVIARVNGLSALAIALPAAIAGAGLYVQSFMRVAARRGYGGDFQYYAFLAFGLLLGGATVLLPGVLLPAVTAAGALILAALAVHLRQTPFLLQAAIALTVAAVESGLLRLVVSGWTARLDTWPVFNGAAVGVLVAAAVCYAAPPAGRLQRDAFSVTARVILGGMVAGGLANVLLLVAGPLVAGRPPADGAVATVRTVILTTSAVLLARLGRAAAWRELAWIAYAALAFGGLKILIEDVPRSQAATLFIALAAYGAALIATPRMMRSPEPAPGASSAAPPGGR